MTSPEARLPSPWIVGSGTAALDSVETPAGAAHGQVGGSAIYFAAAAGAVARVYVVGVVGDDYPMADLAFLERNGADLSGLVRLDGPSMSWSARYAKDASERETLSSDPGVSAAHPPVVPPPARAAPAVFLGSQRPEWQLAVLDQMSAPVIVALDTMMHWIRDRAETLSNLLNRCRVLFVNEAEAMALAGLDQVHSAAAALRDRGPALVVVKRGPSGAVAFGAGYTLRVPVRPVKDVDPTGAGDAFAGGFMGAVSYGMRLSADDVATGLRYGSAAGSVAVEAFGVTGFTRMDPSEIERRAEEIEVSG